MYFIWRKFPGFGGVSDKLYTKIAYGGVGILKWAMEGGYFAKGSGVMGSDGKT